jgi:hypothetical protein
MSIASAGAGTGHGSAEAAFATGTTASEDDIGGIVADCLEKLLWLNCTVRHPEQGAGSFGRARARSLGLKSAERVCPQAVAWIPSSRHSGDQMRHPALLRERLV